MFGSHIPGRGPSLKEGRNDGDIFLMEVYSSLMILTVSSGQKTSHSSCYTHEGLGGRAAVQKGGGQSMPHPIPRYVLLFYLPFRLLFERTRVRFPAPASSSSQEI